MIPFGISNPRPPWDMKLYRPVVKGPRHAAFGQRDYVAVKIDIVGKNHKCGMIAARLFRCCNRMDLDASVAIGFFQASVFSTDSSPNRLYSFGSAA